MSRGPVTIVVAGDDHAHRVLIQRLVDATLEDAGRGGWPDRDELDQARIWFSREHAPALRGWQMGFYNPKDAKADLSRLPTRSGRPLFSNRRQRGEAVAGDSAFDDVIQLMNLLDPRPDMLVMVRDVDRAHDREVLPRRERSGVVEILGLARPEAEAWVLAALERPDPERVEALRRALGFDPTRNPERCNSAPSPSPGRTPRDAKRVLRVLTRHAEELATAEPLPLPPEALEMLLEGLADRLAQLVERGAGCGLAAFCKRLSQALVVPVVGAAPLR